MEIVKKYSIVYADPPWEYNVWSKKGKGRSAESHYPTQSINYLQSLNVPAICLDNCVLLMWATFPCLLDAFKLAEAWGFIYKTVAFTWIKRNKHCNTLFTGMGHYTRANAEIVLLFTKGKPLTRICKSVPQVLIAPRGRHSQKPIEIRERIVKLFGNLPRIELFARNTSGFFEEDEFCGWDVFGNEVNNSINLPIYVPTK